MPSYEYQCSTCKVEFETFQSIHDEPLVDCPECKAPKLQRLISSAGIIFKGSGFYVNDSKEKKAPKKSPSKQETKQETKQEAKQETKQSAKPTSEAPAKTS